MDPSVSSNDETDHHKETCSNRKRSGDSQMESPHAKRCDQTEKPCTDLSSVPSQLNSVYKQLISDEKLTADALRFFVKITKSSYPTADRVILLDPLWFSMSDEAIKSKPKDFDDAGRLAFPVHHNGHWTLCVAYLRHPEPKLINVYHYDSLQNEERFMAVCAHFRKWIEKSELDYHVIFKKADCTQPGDLSGIYVLSELRNFLQFNPATEVNSSGAERNHLVRLIKSDQDFDLDEEDSKLRCGLKEMIEKEEYRVWKNMIQSTTDSIDHSEAQAYEKLERAKEELSHAEEELAKAMAKKENAVEIRDDLADAFNMEGPQTTDSIAMSRVNKMIKKLEACLQDALEAVGHSRSKVAAAQWEVKKIDQMARVRWNLGDEDGSLIIST